MEKVIDLNTEKKCSIIKLMCEKHPAGPLEIPDPAIFCDPKGYEKCFSLCQYTMTLILKEIHKYLQEEKAEPTCKKIRLSDPEIPSSLKRFSAKLLTDFWPNESTQIFSQPPTFDLIPGNPHRPTREAPQEPMPDVDDKANFPQMKYHKIVILSIEHSDISHITLTVIYDTYISFPYSSLDFPFQSELCDIQDCVNYPDNCAKHDECENPELTQVINIKLQHTEEIKYISSRMYRLSPPQTPNQDLFEA